MSPISCTVPIEDIDELVVLSNKHGSVVKACREGLTSGMTYSSALFFKMIRTRHLKRVKRKYIDFSFKNEETKKLIEDYHRLQSFPAIAKERKHKSHSTIWAKAKIYGVRKWSESTLVDAIDNPYMIEGEAMTEIKPLKVLTHCVAVGINIVYVTKANHHISFDREIYFGKVNYDEENRLLPTRIIEAKLELVKKLLFSVYRDVSIPIRVSMRERS